jgi:hypothetical protein
VNCWLPTEATGSGAEVAEPRNERLSWDTPEPTARSRLASHPSFPGRFVNLFQPGTGLLVSLCDGHAGRKRAFERLEQMLAMFVQEATNVRSDSQSLKWP